MFDVMRKFFFLIFSAFKYIFLLNIGCIPNI